MTCLTEGNLQSQFPPGDVAEHYDEWAFYRNQFQSVAGGSKAVDFVFVDDTEKWLIEVKDYRIQRRHGAEYALDGRQPAVTSTHEQLLGTTNGIAW